MRLSFCRRNIYNLQTRNICYLLRPTAELPEEQTRQRQDPRLKADEALQNKGKLLNSRKRQISSQRKSSCREKEAQDISGSVLGAVVKERIVLFLLKNQKSQFECLIPFSHTAIEPVILQTNLTNPQEPDNLSKTDVPCPVRIKRVHHLSLQCFSTDKRITKKIYCQSTEHSTAIHTQRSLILGRLIQQNILSSS